MHETAEDDVRHVDRGVARRQAFLQAARDVFLEQGYEEASVNDVVRRAGGSLATLYAQFGNKEGLFLAVAQDQNDRFVRALTPECVDHLPLKEGLEVIGQRFLGALLARENLAFFRIIVGEGRKFPQLLQRYMTTGSDKVRAVVADYLKTRGPEIADPEAAAPYFLELIRSKHHYRAMSDENYRLTEAEVEQYVAHAVRFFLNGALPR
ncbi:MAG TPA: TetR/AcrR family transcriptional regulator [Vitreimonas sp.]|nr:TetR/AcrR family transcriptional regulator [Vitreimonas sp.]